MIKRNIKGLVVCHGTPTNTGIRFENQKILAPLFQLTTRCKSCHSSSNNHRIIYVRVCGAHFTFLIFRNYSIHGIQSFKFILGSSDKLNHSIRVIRWVVRSHNHYISIIFLPKNLLLMLFPCRRIFNGEADWRNCVCIWRLALHLCIKLPQNFCWRIFVKCWWIMFRYLGYCSGLDGGGAFQVLI